MSILSILTYSRNWTPAEQQLVDFILVHFPEVLNFSSHELAEFSETSMSTIYRVCTKLQIKGFQELKYLLSQEIREEKIIQECNYCKEGLGKID